MFQKLARRVFGSKNERELKKILPLVGKINDLEPQIKTLDDAGLRQKTVEFRERLVKG